MKSKKFIILIWKNYFLILTPSFSLKFLKNNRKTSVLEFLFYKVPAISFKTETSTEVFSCKFWTVKHFFRRLLLWIWLCYFFVIASPGYRIAGCVGMSRQKLCRFNFFSRDAIINYIHSSRLSDSSNAFLNQWEPMGFHNFEQVFIWSEFRFFELFVMWLHF